MSKSETDKKNRKIRSDKFPLTLHPTGQFCKKIKGKLYYFGAAKKLALQRYLEQAAYLHSGKVIAPKTSETTLSIEILCNLYLDHQHLQADVGEIKQRHVYDQISLLKDFVKFIGANCSVSDNPLPYCTRHGLMFAPHVPTSIGNIVLMPFSNHIGSRESINPSQSREIISMPCLRTRSVMRL